MKIGDKVRSLYHGQNGIIIEGPLYGYVGTVWKVSFEGRYPENCNESQLMLVAEPNKQQENKKMEKFYKVMQDTYLFKKGAVLSNKDNSSQFKATHDIWNVEGNDILNKFMSGEPGIASDIVENSPEWFQRVYSKKSLTGIYYVTKEKLRDLLESGKIGEDVEEEK